ncbi:hypothetical protein CsSME_00029744 [Camellia sinensis var. sinensis]
MEEQKQSLLKARWCPLILLLLFLALLKAEKRCSFITSNSDPIYMAYHDEEWGVFIHDDKLLFELLVLTGAQVGSDIGLYTDYGIELNPIRGVVGNANCMLEILVKTSKSEAMSKDMVRRGFWFVNPTVIHSFMLAAGLKNDHLLTCPRHLQCLILASPFPTITPALLK